jgi:hypothetical protein
MRTSALAIIAALALAAASCNDDDPSAPVQSPTAMPSETPKVTTAPEPLLISSPLPAEEAVTADTLEQGAWFVVDVTSGLVQYVMPVEGNPCVDRPAGTCNYDGGIVDVRWHDDDTLVVSPAYGPPIYAGLDKSTAPAATPTPHPPRGERLLISPDGAWAVYGSEGGTEGVRVRLMSDLNMPRWRITNAASQSWSPASPALLALRTDTCSPPDAGANLALFDPETGELREISGESDELIREFQWSPDGSTIAASVIDRRDLQAAAYGRLALVDPETTAVRTLLDPLSLADQSPQFVSVSWNPSGSHVLARGTYGGKGGCEEGVVPTSRVERMTD